MRSIEIQLVENITFLEKIQQSSANSCFIIYQKPSSSQTLEQQKNQLDLYYIYYSTLILTNYKRLMQPKPEKYAFMVDVSGSTGSSANYWDAVHHVFNLYANDIEHYYEWDSGIKKVTKKQMQQQINLREGKGGTSPEVVAKQIVDKQYKMVILITDGQVGDHSVRECDKILQGYKFTKTICYILASTAYGNLNMSVTCPFTRRCQNQVYEKREGQEMKKLVQYTPDDYKILDTLDEITLENFQANYDKIQGLIIALNMGKDGNIPLKNQLLVMKNRLIKQLSKQKGGFDIKTQLRAHLQKGNLQGAIEIADKITKDYFADSNTMELGNKISHLISLCGDLRGKYDLNQIKSNKMAHAQDAKQGQIDQNVDLEQISKNIIECPIMMDQDVPQILVDQCQPILVGLQKAVVDDITSCPIRILNYPQVKAKLKARLSNFTGVKFSDKFFKNPFTQKRLLGAIPLGCHQSHVKVGNFTLAKMLSDGKIVGNINLLFAAIWHIIKEKQIEYLKDIEINAKEHLIFRLKNSNTMASLCGLSQFVTTQLNSDLAVWYCVHSGLLNQPTNRDTFRFHVYNMSQFIQIVKILGYPIDKGVYKHLYRTRSLLRLLAAFKKLSNSQRKSFKEALKCIYQNSIQIDHSKISKAVNNNQVIVKYVPIDGQASKQNAQKILHLLPKDLQELPVEDIVFIGGLIDEQKQASDIALQYNLNKNSVPKAQINWKYGLKKANQFQDEKYIICPKTLRLYSTYDNQKWQNNVEKKFQIPAKDLFKGRKYFEMFLIKYKKIPTKDQLLIFYYNKYVLSKKFNTLPYLTEAWTQRLIEQYSKALEKGGLTVVDAISILAKSRARKDRVNLQKND